MQFVRKVSGFRKPSRANQEAFDAAVAELAATTRTLLEKIGAPTIREQMVEAVECLA